jgi:cytochrome c-type biogenesis protein CcmE
MKLMHPIRRKKLLTILITGGLVAMGLFFILFALKENISLFFTPKDAMSHNIPYDKTIRLGGMVKKGSVQREKGSLRVSFVLTDLTSDILVYYDKVLPDLFREEQGIVARGKLNKQHIFYAEEVLAKHDEKYMPKELYDALKKGKK